MKRKMIRKPIAERPTKWGREQAPLEGKRPGNPSAASCKPSSRPCFPNSSGDGSLRRSGPMKRPGKPLRPKVKDVFGTNSFFKGSLVGIIIRGSRGHVNLPPYNFQYTSKRIRSLVLESTGTLAWAAGLNCHFEAAFRDRKSTRLNSSH